MLPLDRRRSIARRDSLELRQLIANPHFFSRVVVPPLDFQRIGALV
jgi:hypothetical protein